MTGNFQASETGETTLSKRNGGKPKAVVLLSGGLDSATCAAQAIADGFEVIALSFDYGQRHERELLAAKAVVKALGITDH